MKQLIAKTDILIAKAKKLAEHNSKLKQLNEDLENEGRSLKKLVEMEMQKNDDLNNKIKIAKLAQNIGSGGPPESLETTELKRKVDEYIREIDSCITMLND